MSRKYEGKYPCTNRDLVEVGGMVVPADWTQEQIDEARAFLDRCEAQDLIKSIEGVK
jgi:hypothetical protein